VVALCFLTIVFDGYDLIVYGSAVPSLLAEPGWNMGPAQVGAIGSYALAGMLIGALGAGAITDAIGRRRIMLIGISWFSVLMVACSLAPTPGLLGLLRFLAGLGLGGVIPSAIALTVEYAPRGRGSSTTRSCSPDTPSAVSSPRSWHFSCSPTTDGGRCWPSGRRRW
jgi:AAHS family benzoate transporter-like MFS transporter